VTLDGLMEDERFPLLWQMSSSNGYFPLTSARRCQSSWPVASQTLPSTRGIPVKYSRKLFQSSTEITSPRDSFW